MCVIWISIDLLSSTINVLSCYLVHFTIQLRDVDLASTLKPRYCDRPENENSDECRTFRVSSSIISNADNKRSTIKNEHHDANGSERPLSAVHLTNISLLMPSISKEIHTIAQRSIFYNPISEDTLNALSYSSPWAVMTSYSPRHAIRNTRSTIANTTGLPAASKGILFF